MMKATLQGAVLLGFLVLSVPGFAEVQNVKVGGDVTVRAFHRENLDLHDEKSDPLQGIDRQNFLMSTVGVNIGADLTENVSAFLRLANERNWDTTSTNQAGGDLDISQGYVTLKELFYSPLTLRVGLQPIVWGRGFILGSNLLPSVVFKGDDRNSSISANEFTDFTAFDAIRATLDLSGVMGMGWPLTADYVFIRIDENNIEAADDINVQGINFSTRFDAASSELEAYYLNKRDRSAGTSTNDNLGSVSTMGFRGSAQPVEGASLYGELAYQFGKNATDLAGIVPAGDSHQAWAFDFGGDYTFAQIPMTPKAGFEWIFKSGKELRGQSVGGWDPIAPGYFTTAIREFQTQSTVPGFYAVDQPGVTSSATNQHELALYGSFKPIEDLTIAPRLSWFVLNQPHTPQSTGKSHTFVGTEWDTSVTYNYTDDVQFWFLYALFAPGSVYRTPNDAAAQEIVTSVSVKF